MKKLYFLTALIIALAVLASCTSTGGSPAPSAPAKQAEPVYEGEGLSLAEAIEQSAEKIAADLPAGSRVAIVAWESPSNGLSDYLMEELTGALVDRRMEVADRQNLEYVYRELDLQMSGEVSDESARSIGKFLGADLVITGQLTELGGPYRYRASAIHVESATRDSVTRLDVKGDEALRRMVTALANQKAVVKTASYGEGAKSAPGTAVPQTAGVFLDRGITLASQGEFGAAIADFTEAIRLDPNNAAAYFNRALAYAHKGDYDRAIADYSQALAVAPLDPDKEVFVYNKRGVAYHRKADYARARTDYTRVLQLDPNNTTARNNLNRLGDRGR